MGAKKLKKKYIPIKLATEKCTTDASVEDEEIFNYISTLHTSDEGYISVLKKFSKKNTERWSVPVQDAKLLACFKDEKDFYCSVNTHFAPASHSTKSLKRLNAFIIDLDYYKKEHLSGLTATQVVNLLEQELNYPQPSFYIASGQGLYIYWLLNDTYATSKSKKFWSKIEAELINCFKGYGVDERVKDSARVLRMLGSVNSNNNEVVKLIGDNSSLSNPLRYEMMDFADYFWGPKELLVNDDKALTKPKTKTKTKSKKKQTKNKKVIQLKNILTLNHSRYKDIEKLVELRADKDQTGIRELILFIYRLHLLYANVDTDEALKRTIALNNKFLVATDDADISRTDSANKAAETFHRLKDKYDENREGTLNAYLQDSSAYIYKNSTIIKQLGITEEEQKHLSTIIGTKEKKRRKDNRNKEWYEANKEYHQNLYKVKLKAKGKLTRDEQNALRRAEIKALMVQGMTQRDIAKQLGLSVSTVNTHIKHINTEH